MKILVEHEGVFQISLINGLFLILLGFWTPILFLVWLVR